jgi:hypothetical protein
MTETWDNRNKTHGPKPFTTQRGEGRQNLFWKSDCSSEQTNGIRGYLRDAVRTQMEISKWLLELET